MSNILSKTADQTVFKYEQVSNLAEVKETFIWGQEMGLNSIEYTFNPADKIKPDALDTSRIASVRFNNLKNLGTPGSKTAKLPLQDDL